MINSNDQIFGWKVSLTFKEKSLNQACNMTFIFLPELPLATYTTMLSYIFPSNYQKAIKLVFPIKVFYTYLF